MKYETDVEYSIASGEPNFDAKTFELDDNYRSIRVIFEGEPRWENDGIGPYEFWGQKCHDYGINYVSFEHWGSPKWDKKLYTEEENKIITAFADSKFFEDIEDRMCNIFKEEESEDF